MTHASEALPELGTFDLTKVGLGGTLCVGVFLIIGHVAKTIAGPAVILSVIIAAIIAFLAGLYTNIVHVCPVQWALCTPCIL